MYYFNFPEISTGFDVDVTSGEDTRTLTRAETRTLFAFFGKQHLDAAFRAS